MKKSILILAVFLFTQLTNAQLRKSYSEIHKLFPEATSKGLKSEGIFLMEDLILSKNEKRFIIYNTDSIAFGISFSNSENIDEATFNTIVSKELPNFKATKTAKADEGFYYYDTINKYLVLTNQQAEKNKFPIKAFIILIDTFIIEAWTENITNWE